MDAGRIRKEAAFEHHSLSGCLLHLLLNIEDKVPVPVLTLYTKVYRSYPIDWGYRESVQRCGEATCPEARGCRYRSSGRLVGAPARPSAAHRNRSGQPYIMFGCFRLGTGSAAGLCGGD